MLILSRRFDESIIIDDKIIVTVIRIKGDTVRLGIEAPADVGIYREEIYCKMLRNGEIPDRARRAIAGPVMEKCGYCGGTGEVPGPNYDAEGRHRPDYPERVICSFCIGAGRCRDGAKLTPAARH